MICELGQGGGGLNFDATQSEWQFSAAMNDCEGGLDHLSQEQKDAFSVSPLGLAQRCAVLTSLK